MSVRSYIHGGSAVDVVDGVERAVREGTLHPGARLPTVRRLADELQLSPTTVAAAYRSLARRGVVVAQGRNGTSVASAPPLARRMPPQFAPGVRDLASGNPDPALLAPLGRMLAAPCEPAQALYGAVPNHPLLAAVARTRLRADRVAATHLTVVGGAMDGIERVLQAHLRPGDAVAVEDPGYTGLHDLLRALGLVARPVPLDQRGCLPDPLAAVLPGVRACIFIPRAQNPTGAAFDARRAAQLRSVLARSEGVLVIEDDHAGEVAGVLLHSAIDPRRQRWALVRSLCKSLHPDLRIAVLCGDPTTIDRVEGRRQLGTGWVSHTLQCAAAQLWSDPAVMRGLERASATYGRRREGLVEALARHDIAIEPHSGLNAWVPVDDEQGVVAALLGAGWGVLGGQDFRINSGRAIRVTTASLQRDQARRFAADLAAAMSPRAARLA